MELMEQILPANSEDIWDIRHIMEVCVNSLPSRDWFIDDQTDFIEANIDRDGYTLKYMVGDHMAGYLIVHNPGLTAGNLGRHLGFSEAQLLRVRHLESACVLPEYRGRHIQQKLLLEAVNCEMMKPDVHYLLCTVHPDNHFSKINIEKAGLQSVMQIEEHGGWPRIILMKDLNAERFNHFAQNAVEAEIS